MPILEFFCPAAVRARAITRSTFDLAIHRWDQPIETLTRLGTQQGARLIVPRHGEPIEPSLVDGVDPWWRPISALHRPISPSETAEEPESVEEATAEPLD